MSASMMDARDAARWRFCLTFGFPRMNQKGDGWIIWPDEKTGCLGGQGLTPEQAVHAAMVAMRA
jgi:hypothetical protein